MLSTNDQTSPALNSAPSRNERSKRDKLARIKRAARKLFARRGFEATTTREIAESADIGAGTLFLYVGSKEDLLILIFREDMERVVRDAFATMPTLPLGDQFMHVFDAMIAHHALDLGLARVFVKELPFVDDRRHGVSAFLSIQFGGLEELIEQAKSGGELKAEVPSRLLARNLFALFFAELQRWLGRDPVAPRPRYESLRAAIDLHLSGLCRASGSLPSSLDSNPPVRKLAPAGSTKRAANGRTNRKRISRRAR